MPWFNSAFQGGDGATINLPGFSPLPVNNIRNDKAVRQVVRAKARIISCNLGGVEKVG